MLGRHRDLADHAGATPGVRDPLGRAADDVSLPADPEFRAAIMGYAEWGTRRRPTTRSQERARRPRSGAAMGVGCRAPVRPRR